MTVFGTAYIFVTHNISSILSLFMAIWPRNDVLWMYVLTFVHLNVANATTLSLKEVNS